MRRPGFRALVLLAAAGLALPVLLARPAGLSADVVWLMGYVYVASCTTLLAIAVAHARDLVSTRHQTAQIRSFLKYQERKLDHLFGNIEALTALQALIAPKIPLPSTRGDWAVSPDLLKIVGEQILVQRPRTVVELGSGASTVYIGHLLKTCGGGKLFSVDHAAKYFEVTRTNIRNHELNDYVTPIHGPLQDIAINGRSWQWYEIAGLPPGEIDMLIVDGPPASADAMARYPAVPLLIDRLALGAVIVVDDYARVGETEMVRQWVREYPGLLLVAELDTEQGTAVLRNERSNHLSRSWLA